MVDALQGIGAVVSIQLLSRAVTFVLNILVARLASPTAYGIGFVELQLYSNLALFLTKEGFRKVALRADGEAAASLQSSVNLAWCGALVAFVVSVPLACYWLYTTEPEKAVASYIAAVTLMAGASVLEAVGEPFLVAALLAQDFRSRALGEGVALSARTVAMLGIVATLDDLPLAFAASQVLYSIIWVAWFMRLSRNSVGPPSHLENGGAVLPFHRALLLDFGGMVLVKLALTEGEKVMLIRLFTGDDRGVYALVSNLGSIVLRLLFAPTEEIAYSAFSAKGSTDSQGSLLRALLMLQGGVGWLLMCFGPGFAALVIRIFYGKQWAASAAPTVLAAYLMQLFFMALNGILEAYMYSKATPEWVRMCNACQLFISLVLVAVAYLARSLGPVALVLANCTSMMMRVILCAVFVYRQRTLSFADLRLGPLARLFGLFLASGLSCSLLVPKVEEPMPWLRVITALGAAGITVLASAFLCRGQLKQVVQEIRSRKSE